MGIALYNINLFFSSVPFLIFLFRGLVTADDIINNKVRSHYPTWSGHNRRSLWMFKFETRISQDRSEPECLLSRRETSARWHR